VVPVLQIVCPFRQEVLASSPIRWQLMLLTPSTATGNRLRALEAHVILVELQPSQQQIQVKWIMPKLCNLALSEMLNDICSIVL
jgi:hypothetical protein